VAHQLLESVAVARINFENLCEDDHLFFLPIPRGCQIAQFPQPFRIADDRAQGGSPIGSRTAFVTSASRHVGNQRKSQVLAIAPAAFAQLGAQAAQVAHRIQRIRRLHFHGYFGFGQMGQMFQPAFAPIDLATGAERMQPQTLAALAIESCNFAGGARHQPTFFRQESGGFHAVEQISRSGRVSTACSKECA
jgi:hypothetical protein